LLIIIKKVTLETKEIEWMEIYIFFEKKKEKERISIRCMKLY